MQKEHSMIEDGPEGEPECECQCFGCLDDEEHCGSYACEGMTIEDDYDDSDEARWEDQDRGLDD